MQLTLESFYICKKNLYSSNIFYRTNLIFRNVKKFIVNPQGDFFIIKTHDNKNLFYYRNYKTMNNIKSFKSGYYFDPLSKYILILPKKFTLNYQKKVTLFSIEKETYEEIDYKQIYEPLSLDNNHIIRFSVKRKLFIYDQNSKTVYYFKIINFELINSNKYEKIKLYNF